MDSSKKNVAILADERFAWHLTGRHHPEKPSRTDAILQALKEKKLLLPENLLTPRSASKEEIALIHLPVYIELVEQEALKCTSLGILDGSYTLVTGDVQISPPSYDVAKLAAGGVLTAVDSVMKKAFSSAFCVIRPPGHHASINKGMGFCLFNNVAIGAKYAISKYGLSRILIVDWDVHHGNGTQDIFESDSRVFYFSTHQSPLYPGTGARDERGCGNILNCPIAPGKLSRLHVMQAFQNELLPAMEYFQPECIFISAGFDAHRNDPLGGMNLTEEDFGELTLIVKEIAEEHCEGRIISTLEGGYDLQALASSSVEHVKALES